MVAAASSSLSAAKESKEPKGELDSGGGNSRFGRARKSTYRSSKDVEIKLEDEVRTEVHVDIKAKGGGPQGHRKRAAATGATSASASNNGRNRGMGREKRRKERKGRKKIRKNGLDCKKMMLQVQNVWEGSTPRRSASTQPRIDGSYTTALQGCAVCGLALLSSSHMK